MSLELTEDERLSLIKNILLTDDRDYATQIASRIDMLENILSQRKELSEKIDPIIFYHLDNFIEEIPEKLGPTITETLKVQIKESKDEVVEALYPIMGKMIKRFVQNEIKILTEKVNDKVANTFSIKSLLRKFKGRASGVSEKGIILSELSLYQLEQVFVLEKGSGLVIASYSKKDAVDSDMLGGMLTAIKSFVEDAFKGDAQSLNAIEYDNYEIHLYNFHNYYIATAINGSVPESMESLLENEVLDFAQALNSVKEPNNDLTSALLKERFETFEFKK